MGNDVSSLLTMVKAVQRRILGSRPHALPRQVVGKVTAEPRPPRIPAELLPTKPRSCVIIADVATEAVQAYLDQVSLRPTELLLPSTAVEPPLRDGRTITVRRVDTLDQVHEHLARHGPAGILILARPVAAADEARILGQLLFHVAKHGTLIIDLDQTLRGRPAHTRPAHARTAHTQTAPARTTDPRQAPGLDQGLRVLVEASQGHPPSAPTAWEREVLACTDEVRVDDSLAIVRKRYHHLLKLRSSGAESIMATREPAVDVETMAELPAGTLTSSSVVTSHPADAPVADLQTTFDHPELQLRRYTGRVGLVRNGLVFTRNCILPDAFRHHLRTDLVNGRVIGPVTSDFGRLAAHHWPKDRMQGIYYNVDSEKPGHFGHLTTEVVSRLWGWDQAKREHPELKAIMRIRFPGEREPELERRVFGGFGIDASDLVVVDHPVYLESLVSAMPMFHNHRPHYVHPDLPTVWRRIGDGLTASSTSGDITDYTRVFVSRRDTLGARRCRNAGAVEQLFAAHGFTVVYPEDVDLGVQAALFASAKVVAGFGGSGMFNMMYGRSLEHVIVLNQWAYDARNEHLFACALGADLHYFWSRPDVEQPLGGWTWKAYRSAWDFDFASNEAALRELLDQLGS